VSAQKKIVSRAMVVVWLVVAVMCVIYRCIPLLLVHAACVSSCIWILEVLCERYPTLRYKADYRSLRNGSRINCISTLELPLSCNLSPSPTPLRCGPHVHVPWLRVPAPASACALERRCNHLNSRLYGSEFKNVLFALWCVTTEKR
jgi:hypothetical protein